MKMDTRQERNKKRLLSSTVSDPESGCWIWRGQISNSGYGRMMYSDANGRVMESAHRASYMAFVGPIPEGTIIRQNCGNRLCINPDHLEVIREQLLTH